MTRNVFPDSWHRAAKELSDLFGGIPVDTILDERNGFYLQLIDEAGELHEGKHLVDIGCGLSWLGPLASKLGMKVSLVDDFGGGGGVDNANRAPAMEMVERFRKDLPVAIIETDLLTEPLPFETGSVDILTCFHVLEHWHHSPKALFAEIHRVLRPGGHIVFATPNAANVRKRFAVITGINIWSPLDAWFHAQPHFRGHVREPIVRDLHQIFQWSGFAVTATHGRNFIGRDSYALSSIPRPIRHGLAIASQSFLQFFPTLCSDLHVIGRKE